MQLLQSDKEHLEPVMIFRFVQGLSQSICALDVSTNKHRNHTSELYQITKVMHSTIKVFCSRGTTNVVSHVNNSSVVDCQNQSGSRWGRGRLLAGK